MMLFHYFNSMQSFIRILKLQPMNFTIRILINWLEYELHDLIHCKLLILSVFQAFIDDEARIPDLLSETFRQYIRKKQQAVSNR